MIKAVGYVRVSTDKQGISLEAQQGKIGAMALVKDAELVDVIVDEDESGKSLERPGMQKLMGLVRGRPAGGGGVGMVIIAKLDRMTRSVRDLGTIVDLFNKKDVSLISVAETLDTGTAAGRMVMNIMASVAQWEREEISERTGMALQHKVKKGMLAGNHPYGFSPSGDPPRPDRKYGDVLIENLFEQEVLARARTLRKEGMSLRKIAEQLNAEGYRTRAGGEWRFQYVGNILRRQAVEA